MNAALKNRLFKGRHIFLGALLLLVWLTQTLPGWGEFYARQLYPGIALCLSSFSDLFPFAIGDLFIALSLMGLIVYPVYARRFKRKTWKNIVFSEVEYVVWIYVWFYAAWGLNYSQNGFYQRTGITPVPYTPESFQTFTHNYVERLNASYTEPPTEVNRPLVCQEAVRGYRRISSNLEVHRPLNNHPRVKVMLFTPLISMVGVTGSMGPFFCEFTVNGDVLPADYPSTYAHEIAHLLGITSEAEANFYAYQVCTRSTEKHIRFSGYYSILPHVLNNAYRLMDKEAYQELLSAIRPEIIRMLRDKQTYWEAKYSPLIGRIQDWMYDLYLKGNKIPGGQKNYSEVIGLLISYEQQR